MQLKGNAYTFFFALLVCVICSALLSLVSEGLRDKREVNIALDIKKNILKAVQLNEPLAEKAEVDEILEVYKNKIKEFVVDNKGEVVEGKLPEDIIEGEELFPLFAYEENGKILAFCFPIVGKGLWSTLYGYLAIEPDAKTVRGITFYEHGETPGLGAEISEPWFQENFKGKSIWDADQNMLKPVSVIKGKVADKKSEKEAAYFVDGISGATVTSRGVAGMVDREVRKYEPFFSNIRK